MKNIAVIDLTAIEKNARFIRGKLKNKIFFAVVKADGYGHGAEQVAHSIENIADGFCVAIVEEGAALRLAGISKPILVFTPPTNKSDIERMAFYNLTATVNSESTAKLVRGLPCHIKVNTGMNRYGCNLSELPEVLSILNGGQIEGVYSHLYAAEDGDASLAQLELFNRAEKLVKSVNPDICAHLSASGGFLRGGDFLKDGVRCGILLYGYAPDGFKADVSPALKVFAKRVQQTEFIGGGAGYGRAEKNYETLYSYRLGYADGFLRGVPLGVNKLCMDAFISEQNGEYTCVLDNAEDYARKCGTISYEVLTSVTRRSERIYLR